MNGHPKMPLHNTPAEEDSPAPAAWREHRLPGFMGAIGPMLTRRDAAGWCYALQITERHLNQAGVMHGGVCATLLDQASSAVAWEHSGRAPCVTVQLNTNFLRPARLGQTIIARAQVTHAAGSLLFMTGLVETDDGSLLANGQAVMKRLGPVNPVTRLMTGDSGIF